MAKNEFFLVFSKRGAFALLHPPGSATAQAIKNFWGQYVYSWNPVMQPGNNPEHFFWHARQHQCTESYAQIQNLPRDLQDLVNFVSKHTQCSVNYCLCTDANGVQCCRFDIP